jgi:hypothetical protein
MRRRSAKAFALRRRLKPSRYIRYQGVVGS